MASIEREIDKKERMLSEEESKPSPNQSRNARLKVEIAMLKIDEEESQTTPNQTRIARLKDEIAELTLKEDSYEGTIKGA